MAEIDEVALETREQTQRPGRLPDDATAGIEQPLVTVEDAMTLEQARALSGRRGARLVLLMGESATGKTALTAMLWQQFLEQDGLAGHRLAGSRCAAASSAAPIGRDWRRVGDERSNGISAAGEEGLRDREETSRVGNSAHGRGADRFGHRR